MSDDIKAKTRKTADLYFSGVKDETPYELWKFFDRELAGDLSLFITGSLYSREKIPHTTRQLAAVASLTSLERPHELKLHIHAAFNVGCSREEIAEVIFQCCVYCGMPATNTALKVLREVIRERED